MNSPKNISSSSKTGNTSSYRSGCSAHL